MWEVSSHISQWGQPQGPLFFFDDDRYLTLQHFSIALNSFLKQLHIDKQFYNTHSFRIGAVTTVRQTNIPDSYFKMLGSWKNNAYQSYIKTLQEEIAKLSKYLMWVMSGYP